MVFELNLITVKLVQEEAIVDYAVSEINSPLLIFDR